MFTQGKGEYMDCLTNAAGLLVLLDLDKEIGAYSLENFLHGIDDKKLPEKTNGIDDKKLPEEKEPEPPKFLECNLDKKLNNLLI